MNDSSFEIRVRGVALEGEEQNPVVILGDDEGDHVVPVPIGPAEANAIIVELEHMAPPQPLAYDVFINLFTRHHFRCDRLELYGFRNGDYLARMRYHRIWGAYTMELRPADGIALAVRFNVPIVIARSACRASAAAGKDFSSFTYTTRDCLFLDHVESLSRSVN